MSKIANLNSQLESGVLKCWLRACKKWWRCCVAISHGNHQGLVSRDWHFPYGLHPCPPMLFKLCPCIQKLSNVHYPPTPSLGWIGQIKDRSLSLAIVHKPMPNNIAAMPTQNPWAWALMGVGVGAHCRSLMRTNMGLDFVANTHGGWHAQIMRLHPNLDNVTPSFSPIVWYNQGVIFHI